MDSRPGRRLRDANTGTPEQRAAVAAYFTADKPAVVYAFNLGETVIVTEIYRNERNQDNGN